MSYIHGWDISERYYHLFEEKKMINIYSVYGFLLQYILSKYRIRKEDYHTSVLQASGINSYLKSVMGEYSRAEKLCFIGERLENKEYLIERINKYHKKDILIITIF